MCNVCTFYNVHCTQVALVEYQSRAHFCSMGTSQVCLFITILSIIKSSVVDPDRVGSASFCQIRIGIGIHAISIRIGINSKYMFFYTHS
jgi:hypothetical protein